MVILSIFLVTVQMDTSKNHQEEKYPISFTSFLNTSLEVSYLISAKLLAEWEKMMVDFSSIKCAKFSVTCKGKELFIEI